MKTRGLVLAGGQSSRFGKDKALAHYAGKTFLETAVDLLDAVDVQPVVVTRGEADYSFLKCPVLKDKLKAHGPLGGIYTAMSVYPGTRFVVLTCDMPALNVLALTKLLSYERVEDIVIFSHQGSIQPFPGIYSFSLSELIIRRLLRENYSMMGLIEEAQNKDILPWEGDSSIFANINYPEDIPHLNPLTA